MSTEVAEGSARPAPARPARTVLLVLVALALAAAVAVNVHHVTSAWIGDAGVDKPFLGDFRDTIWSPVRDLIHGHNPYDTTLPRGPGEHEFDLYSPSWLALALPFAALSLGSAAAVWLVVQVALAVALAAALLVVAGVRRSPAAVLGLAAVVLLCQPGRAVFNTGQAAFFFAAGTILAISFATRRPLLAGLALVAVASKPQFLLPVLVLLLVGWRAWRAVAVGLLATAALAVGPLVASIVAAGGVGDFVGSIVDNLRFTSRTYGRLTDPDLVRIDLANVVAKLGHIDIGTPLQLFLAMACLGVAVFALRRLLTAPPTAWTEPIAVALAATTILLALPHFPYDAILLLWPVVVLIAAWRADGPPASAVVVLLVVLCLPLLHRSEVDTLLDKLGLPARLIGSIDSVLLLIAFVIAVVIAVRVPRIDRQVVGAT